MSKLSHVRNALGVVGPRGLGQIAWSQATRHRSRLTKEIRTALTGAKLLEVGGASTIFGSEADRSPAYRLASSIDNVNFAGATLWENDLTDGGAFMPEGSAKGIQYLREASAVTDLGPYDGVISSHVIEHLANPLSALRAWRKITGDDGFLLLVLPHRDGTFDRLRPITTLNHMRADEARDMPETDDTHADEILALHDMSLDPGTASMVELEARVANNLSTRAMHHHTFNSQSALEMVVEAGWNPVGAVATWPHNIYLLARANASARPALALEKRISSPFSSDR